MSNLEEFFTTNFLKKFSIADQSFAAAWKEVKEKLEMGYHPRDCGNKYAILGSNQKERGSLFLIKKKTGRFLIEIDMIERKIYLRSIGRKGDKKQFRSWHTLSQKAYGVKLKYDT